MNGQGHNVAAGTADWPDLLNELDRWGVLGRAAPLWWRDDDAIAPTPQLDALLRLAAAVPVGLAVIPATARPDLRDALDDAPLIAVLQHGWRHANRAAGGRKSEYPEGRPAGQVVAEIAAGQARLKALFGGRALPVLVPPWNRFAADLLPLLPASGIAGLSALAARQGAGLPPGIAAIDVHVDLIAWRAGGGFIGAAAALGRLVDELRRRRQEAGADRAPIGILTHHLVMDSATGAFLEQLMAVTGDHPAVRWVGAGEMLQ